MKLSDKIKEEEMKKTEERNERPSRRNSDRRRTKGNKRSKKDDARIKADSCKADANDPSWYASNPQILTDAASLPYSHALGSSYRITSELGHGSTTFLDSIAGIMSIRCVPSIGVALNANDPINIAARNVYSFVRHANSGSKNYDYPDLMMYLLAMTSVYSYHSFLRRIYGIAMTYSPMNRYYPKAVIEAMGVSFDNVISNLAQLRLLINTVAVKAGSMAVPNTMSYIKRQIWMYEGFYQDGTSVKSQTYLYTPSAFYQFNALWDDTSKEYTGGELNLLRLDSKNNGNPLTVADLEGIANELLNPIIANEDMNIMSGDILKAYSINQLIFIPDTPENYTLTPGYNAEVLAQMQNCYALGGKVDTKVTQNPNLGAGYLISKPYAEYTTADNVYIHFANQARSRMLTTLADMPTPGLNMIMTRLIPVADAVGINTDSKKIFMLATGSEIVESVHITTFAMQGGEWKTKDLTTTFAEGATFITHGDGNYLGREVEFLKYLSQFDQHPSIDLVKLKSNPQDMTLTGTFDGSILDVANFTVVSQNVLAKLHEVALISEFDVLQVGR